jgi:hypothetical protein
VDEYELEAIGRDHPIAAGLFVPFVIARLRGEAAPNESILTVDLPPAGDGRPAQRTLRLFWSADSVLTQPPPVQENVLTEWAALGVACVVLARYGGMRIRAVAARGDRFDYWVADGDYYHALEVSGTTTDDLASRHREKVGQLLDNPFGLGGYVIVVGFRPPRVVWTYHRPEGGAP